MKTNETHTLRESHNEGDCIKSVSNWCMQRSFLSGFQQRMVVRDNVGSEIGRTHCLFVPFLGRRLQTLCKGILAAAAGEGRYWSSPSARDKVPKVFLNRN